MRTRATADLSLGAAAGSAPWTLVGGKGGVGKTTIAASLAITLADAGEEVLLLSVDPAHSLGDALGLPLSREPRDVPGVPRLEAMELDAEHERDRWIAAHRDALLWLLEEGTFLERREIAPLLDLALPGIDELASMLRLTALGRSASGKRLVVDTAPTGHALRLLRTPDLVGAWVETLASLDARRRTVAETLSRRTLAPDAPQRLVDSLRDDVRQLARRLGDPEQTRCLLVCNPEPMVLAETRRYREALDAAGIAVGALIVNRARDTRAMESGGAPVLHLPLLPDDPRGVTALREFARRDAAEGGAGSGEGKRSGTSALSRTALRIGGRWQPPADRRLYIVGGKGGVGKTTIACALAALLASQLERRTLLLSVDPAGSLGDVWRVAPGNEAIPAPGLARLLLRQLDAEATWAAFQQSEREGLAGVLASFAGDADGALREQLSHFEPPGLDELVAMAELSDLVSDASYDAVVVDTAPTGHLRRLLDAPALALDWSHAILRLMLRYRDVAGLGVTAERVLRFAHEIRSLQALLRDRARTFVAVVALPEALSVPETERLLDALRERAIHPDVLVVNRYPDDRGDGSAARHASAAALLALPGHPVTVAAPALATRPRSASALLAFARAWSHLGGNTPTEAAA